MKAKVSRGAGFRGLLDYIYGPGEDNHPGRAVPVSGAGNVLGTDPRDLARQFAVSRQLRPDIKKPVWHCSLSLPPGEKLSDERWAEIARDFLSRMGLDPDARMWHCARHIDTDHDHIHLVVSRVALDASSWGGGNDARQAIEVTQDMEKVHGLQLTPGSGEGGERKGLTKGEIGQFRRTGKVPDRRNLQKRIDSARKDCPDFPTFVALLRKMQVQVLPNGETGQVSGISFRLKGGGDPFSGTKLGMAYKWQRIAEDTGYDHDRDAELIAQLRKEAAEAREAGSIGPAGPETTENQKIHRARGQIDPGKERDRYFVRQEDGSWSWKSRPDIAVFRLEGEQVTVLSRQDMAVRAALLTAAETFGSPLQVNGEDEFRRKVWLAGGKMGLEIVGYDPTADDLAELAAWREKHGGLPVPDSIGPAQPVQQNNEVQPGYTLPEEVAAYEPDSENGRGDRVPDGAGTPRDSRAATAAHEIGGAGRRDAPVATDIPAAGRDTAAPAADSGAGGRYLAVAAGTANPGGPGDRDADRAVAAATRKGDGSRDDHPQSHGVPGGSGGAVAGRNRGVQSSGSTDASRREGLAAGRREIPAAVGDADVGSRGQRAGSDTSGPVADPDGAPVLRPVPPVSIVELSDFGRSFRACLAAEQAGPDDAQGGKDISRDVGESICEGTPADRGDHNPTATAAPGAAVAASDQPSAPDAEKIRSPQQKRKSSAPGG
ncbi:MAG: relaxase/mobilization nuclease domain-containing protein [Proteobacteria bacterium]|nr:relaxase/mobilization nuclease domain-containing protein [Pseudomonadota bacterium]